MHTHIHTHTPIVLAILHHTHTAARQLTRAQAACMGVQGGSGGGGGGMCVCGQHGFAAIKQVMPYAAQLYTAHTPFIQHQGCCCLIHGPNLFGLCACAKRIYCIAPHPFFSHYMHTYLIRNHLACWFGPRAPLTASPCLLFAAIHFKCTYSSAV